MNFDEILQKQKDFFNTNATKDIHFRKQQLQKLKDQIKKNEKHLYDAIFKDLKKSAFETYSTELTFIYNEIDFFLKKLSSFAKPKKVKTNLSNQMGKSRIYYEPFGTTLIIGAWNYPYQLSIVPAISAIAAGNTVIIKPSEIAEHSARAMEDILNAIFPENFLKVINGGIPETTELLKLKFDKIFFTGSPKVGKIVYEAAAKNLIPVTLELGGKSPAIITDSAKLEVAAKRIVWGKFLNAGQTCIAPDYILVDKKVKPALLEKIKVQIEKSDYHEGAEHYTNIINERNFERLTKMMDQKKVVVGGKTESQNLHIEPTVMDNVTWEDPVMQEEIFGPILPILTFDTFDDAINTVKAHEKPLSAYLFSENQQEKTKFVDQLSFGGGCINDTLMYMINPSLPFGGVGNSGFGSYHGFFGFETFSHKKAVLEKATWGEPNWKYPPYNEGNKNILKKIL